MRLALLAVFFATPALGAETATFLNIGVGARGLGMGGAYTALADDANALYWNPGGLSAVEKREFTASHAELFESTRHDFLAYAHPLKQGVLAGGFTYLSQGGLDGRDSLGRPTASVDASDAALSMAFASKLDVVEAGLSLKYVRSHVGSVEAHTAALDLGARRVIGNWGPGALSLGAALRNLGPGLKYENQRNDLPLRIAGGLAYKTTGGHAVAVDIVNGPRGAGSEAALGGEFQAVKNLHLRAGYTTQTAITGGSGFDAARGLSMGLGFRNDRWGLDYAILPSGELGRSHRFTLAVRW